MKKVAFLYLLFMSLLLAGCARDSQGNLEMVKPPETSAQRIAVGYSLVTETRLKAIELLDKRYLSVQSALQVQHICDTARDVLDAAKLQFVNDPVKNQPKVDKLLSSFDSVMQTADVVISNNRARP